MTWGALSSTNRMTIDLSQLNATQIGLLAVAATCFAAILAAVGALVVAIVNSQSVRRVARETARREFRLNGVKPYLDFLDRRLSLYDDLIGVGPDLVSALNKLVASLTSTRERAIHEPQKEQKPQETPQDLQRSLKRLQEIQLNLGELATVFRDTGLFAFILSDHKVLYKTHKWLEKDRAFFDIVLASGGITAAPEQLRKLKESAREALNRAVYLRIAIEEVIFGNRSWLARGSYFMLMHSRARWRKLISHRRSKK